MPLPAFVHRRNETGTYDSICSRCAVTIVCALDEQSLGSGEMQHLCDELMLKKRAERVEWYHTHPHSGMHSQWNLRHSA
jgi:proteasome lid subunit RPN8/RPN11